MSVYLVPGWLNVLRVTSEMRNTTALGRGWSKHGPRGRTCRMGTWGRETEREKAGGKIVERGRRRSGAKARHRIISYGHKVIIM